MSEPAEALLQHMGALTTVSAGLRAAVQERAVAQRIAKGEHLHQAGRVCQRTYWIASGLLRSYYLKEGREVTDFFATQNDWLTAHSFFTEEPDQSYLQALEPGTLFSLTQTDLQALFDDFPEMERFGRIVMAKLYLRQSERLATLQFTTASDKYAHFCRSHGALLPRLPLGMVASYLGIAQETLSRVRGGK